MSKDRMTVEEFVALAENIRDAYNAHLGPRTTWYAGGRLQTLYASGGQADVNRLHAETARYLTRSNKRLRVSTRQRRREAAEREAERRRLLDQEDFLDQED